MAIRKTNDIRNESSDKFDKQKLEVSIIEERFDDTTHNDNPYDDALQYLSKKIDEVIDQSNSNSKPIFVQYNCTNTTQGIQGRDSYTIPFDQQEVISDTSDFTLDRGAITVVNAGTYEIHFGIVIYGRIVRANPLIQVYVGSTAKNIYGGTYIRNSSGHNRTVSQGTGLLQLSANDSITVRSIYNSNWGASGSITMLAGTKIIIKKIG